MTNKNFLDTLRSKYFELKGAEQKVAAFILENTARMQTMSITELAKESGVSEATVSRFCKRMSLVGFFALKLEIARSLHTDITPAAKATELSEKVALEAKAAIDSTVAVLSEEGISDAVSMLEKAERVLSVGYGSTDIMAKEFTSVFSAASLKFSSVTDSHIQAATLALLNEKDLLVLFSYSGATLEGTELLKQARANRVPTLLITHFAESPSAAYADKILCYGVDENPYRSGSVPVRIAQLVLIDLLWREFYSRNEKLCDENIRKKTDALAKKHI